MLNWQHGRDPQHIKPDFPSNHLAVRATVGCRLTAASNRRRFGRPKSTIDQPIEGDSNLPSCESSLAFTPFVNALDCLDFFGDTFVPHNLMNCRQKFHSERGLKTIEQIANAFQSSLGIRMLTKQCFRIIDCPGNKLNLLARVVSTIGAA